MEEYSKSNEALGLYNLEEERERIQNTIVNHAVKVSVAKAVEENSKKMREEMAQKMLKNHMPISEIIDYTGLSEEEINKLSKY